MRGDDLERTRELIRSLPKCVKCGHNALVHTFRFHHPKDGQPAEPVGCSGEFNRGDCDCTGWQQTKPLSES